MKAIRIDTFGGPEVMNVRDVDIPNPAPNEVLVRNLAVGVNPVDFKIRQGQYPEVKQDKLPLTMGREVAGLVEAVGLEVDDFRPGDRVFAMIGADGGYAQYARVPAAHLAIVPSSLDWRHAAGVPLAAHTAWQALVEHGQLEQGQKVLIHGGTGGVGHFAVQFARIKEKFEDICSDFDLVIDLIGGDTQARSWQVLGEGGRLVSTLTMPDAHHPQAKGKTGTRFTARPDGRELAEIAGLIEAGQVIVQIQKVYDLIEAAEALDFIANEHVHGKVVLRVA
jgi:NADPH:quinone reductase-like Zn-dependent oxidoreductase